MTSCDARCVRHGTGRRHAGPPTRTNPEFISRSDVEVMPRRGRGKWPKVLLGVLVVVLRPAAPAHGAGSDANQPDSMTEAIVVKSTRPTVRNLIDRKVYEVSVDLQSTMGTAADVLNKIPSVEVDADGAVSLRGNTKVTILVDGKPSAELTGAYAGDGLLNFPASDIERIEVLNNPPPQFNADASAGVINIITRKHRKPG